MTVLPFIAIFVVLGVILLRASHAATPAATITGDLNSDNSVNVFDLSILLSHWQQTGSGTVGDLNNDSIVNIFDLSILLSSYGQSSSGGGGTCTNAVSCWPNASNTGYQNAPGYPGTPGVADPSKLATAASGSPTCPTTFQSSHTYSFCHYTSGQWIGAPGGHVHDVHFIGDLFDVPFNDAAIMTYCDSNCTFDYLTIKPQALSAPDLPGHGVSYNNSYGIIMGAGWGAYYTVGHGVSLAHSDIWGWRSGIILGDSGGVNTAATPVLIQDNYIHDDSECINIQSCTTHTDGIGMVDTGGTAEYITINHNFMPMINNNTNDIAFQSGTYHDLAITNNVLSGDGYTVAVWGTSHNITFTGNVYTNYGQPEFGVMYPQDFWDTPGSVWAHNKFLWDPGGVNPFYSIGPGNGNSGQLTATDSGKCWVPSGISTTDYGGGSC